MFYLNRKLGEGKPELSEKDLWGWLGDHPEGFG